MARSRFVRLAQRRHGLKHPLWPVARTSMLQHLVAVMLVEPHRGGVLGVDDDPDAPRVRGDLERTRLGVKQEAFPDSPPAGSFVDRKPADDHDGNRVAR